MHLIDVRNAAVVLAPCGFLRIADEVRTGDVVGMAHFAATQAGEEAFRLVRAGDAVAVAD